MTANNPNITDVAGSQGSNVFAAINDARDAVENSATGAISFTLTSTSKTLTSPEFWADNIFILAAGSPAPGGAITLTVPAESRGVFVVVNDSGETVTVEISGQSKASPTITDATTKAFVSDGVNVRGLSSAAGAATLYSNVTATLSVGFAADVYDNGTQSSGTLTPDEADGNMQKAVNGGAHTLAPPINNCTIIMQYTNNGSAGTITTSGFSWIDGDSLTTTDTEDFLMQIVKINGFSALTVKALQ